MNYMPTPSVEFSYAVKRGFRNLFNFKGRDRRSEYWWFALVIYGACLLLNIFLSLLSNFLNNDVVVCSFFMLELVLPPLLLLSAQTRRLHDTGHSAILPIFAFLLWLVGIFGILISFSYLFLFSFSVFVALCGGGFDGAASNDLSSYLFLSLWLMIGYAIVTLIIFVLTLKDSDCYENQYGPSKKYPWANEEINDDF